MGYRAMRDFQFVTIRIVWWWVKTADTMFDLLHQLSDRLSEHFYAWKSRLESHKLFGL